MRRINVIVTGLGAVIGQGISYSLRQSKHKLKIIGIDKNPQSIAHKFCDKFIAKPDVDESSHDYLNFWDKIISDESVDIIFPGIEVDVLFLNRHREHLGNQTKLVLNSHPLIELASDKWQFYNYIKDKGYSTIPTLKTKSWDECVSKLGKPPFLIKPCYGNGSRGIHIIEDKNDLDYRSLKSNEDFIVQPYIGHDNDEYTAASFGLDSGRSLSPIIFQRQLSPYGNTVFAKRIKNKEITNHILTLSQMLKPIGPTNYQFRRHNGDYYLLEVNPRISSSTSIRTHFGYNESEMAMQYFLDKDEPHQPTLKNGTAWRYLSDHIVFNE